MKYAVTAVLLLLSRVAAAHHTLDHRMLAEDSAEVIAATRPGVGGDWAWLPWVVLVALFVLGAVRWWSGKS